MGSIEFVKGKLRGARERIKYGSPWLAPAPARRVPECPPGWRTGPPDFIGIGAQKAGTSWWDALVQAHPDVHQPPSGRAKELHFFARFWHDRFTEADVAAYARYFPRPEGGLAGEWTPRYMADFWAAPLLARAAPQARLLVALRDPVERYVSGATFNATHRAPLHPVVAQESAWRGFYHLQLSHVLEHFDRDRVLVLQYEACRQAPAEHLARTYRFLGLDDGFVPAGLEERVNATTAAKELVPDHVVDALRALYRPDVERLAADFPEIDLALWPGLGK